MGRPLALGGERAVRDTDRRELEHCAEVEREAGSARMVAAGRVDQEHIRPLRQRANGGFQECALAESKQARLVRAARMTRQTLVSDRVIRVLAWALAVFFLTHALVGFAGMEVEWWLYGPGGLVIGLLALVVAGSGGAWPRFHWPARRGRPTDARRNNIRAEEVIALGARNEADHG